MKQKLILLVEDNEDDIFFFEHAAKKAALKNPVQLARDGLEAIQYLSGTGHFIDREQYPYPSILILDLSLPLKHGLEVLRWIHSSGRGGSLLVVILTSSSSELDMREAYQLGVNSYLVKPGDPDKLYELLKLFKSYWLEANEFPPAEKRPKPHCINPTGGRTPFAEMAASILESESV